MNKTKIDWCDYTINPIKGKCLNKCWYCYARRMYNRFKWNDKVRIELEALNQIDSIKEPSKIFLCSTHDLFGNWIPDKWIFKIITACHKYSQHTFILLTKNPGRYKDWTFRENFWLGTSISGQDEDWRCAFATLKNIQNNIKFVSIEPLLNEITLAELPFINWIIIGGLTPKLKHKKEWIDKILSQAKHFDIPVFIKHNAQYQKIITNFPKRIG